MAKAPATPAPAAKPVAAPAAAPTRLMSIDAVRGFDMFWIIGGGGLIQAAIRLFANPLPAAIQTQMGHVNWEGFTAWDLIMPLFLFIVGTSMPFSFTRRIEAGHRKFDIYAKVFRRVVVLWVLGMIAQGNLLAFDLAKLQVFSNTLQSIAVGYLIAAVALIHLPRWGQALTMVGLLAVFWAIMVAVPFNGQPAGLMEEKTNLALYIDEVLLRSFRNPATTYAWILPGLGNGATVLLGVLSGHLLRSSWSAALKVVWLVLAGAACLATGWIVAGGPARWLSPDAPAEVENHLLQLLWSVRFPIIKHLWTSSMVLWAAGWSYLLLALFYLVIDVLGWRRWALPFVVIGMNAILAYMLTHPFNVGAVSGQYVAGLASHLGRGGPLLGSAASFGLVWVILYYLYRNRHFLRV